MQPPVCISCLLYAIMKIHYPFSKLVPEFAKKWSWLVENTMEEVDQLGGFNLV